MGEIFGRGRYCAVFSDDIDPDDMVLNIQGLASDNLDEVLSVVKGHVWFEVYDGHEIGDDRVDIISASWL